MTRRLPVFPLGSVLLPYGLLPLHVFEQRYRALMADLLERGEPGRPEMGVVLIERGHEVGGGDQRSSIGTIAQIVQAEKLPDGRWLVVAAGVQRFFVASWLPDDPYPLAEVDEIPPEAWDERWAGALGSAEQEVRRALALASELGESAPQPELSDDPPVATWQLCNAVPVGPFDRHRLLCADGAASRLELLETLAREAATVLAMRLGQGA